ncbi:tail fiber protein [Aeromonas veronii]|nr:tail fiber protein [Aeromonas veronii]
MKRRHIALATTLLAGLLPQAAQACGDGAYIGQVCFMATKFCPVGTREANGATLAISQNQAIYSLLSTTYGGDGKTTFNLPDLRGRSPRGVGPAQALSNEKRTVSSVALGQKAGFSTAIIPSSVNLPQHNHSATFTPSGVFKVTASLPVSGATGNLSALSSGTGYLAGLAGKNGALPVPVTGYTTTEPAAGGATLPVTTQVNYSAEGSAVVVGNTGTSEPYYSDSPSLGLMACIVIDGIYPQRP